MHGLCNSKPLSLFQPTFPTRNHSRTSINKLHIVKMATDFDRAAELKQFDETKAGVKGLLDAGLNQIPRIFIHPPETLSDLKPTLKSSGEAVVIPTIDLAGLDSPDLRPSIVDQIRNASSTFGFFQIINHGVPQKVLDDIIDSIRAFHELPSEAKSPYYQRNVGTGVSYLSNIDLFKAKAASWRDTLQIGIGPAKAAAAAENIPEVCRAAVAEWASETERLGFVLEELLSEGLGLKSERLKEATYGERRMMVGHYYPYCPQPDLTVGIKSHTDPGVLTVLLQDHIGGLQIRHGGGWVDVEPVAGALVINIGDLLQIASNDVYKSVEHRVLANGKSEARISIAVFYNPEIRDNLYGPLPELITPETPAVYRQFTYDDYITRFFNKELDGKSLPNHYRI
ncbi:1-aminocyclopropane-1-carboxylate oxidase homolog 3-like [Cucurbita maxima]|uniref:1-aminocyclopropane-1-carboxylate oxidase homolog 3-like n=1 Tax=Cucurbita maxima TaxID=3661 RepID=A0A6J1J854_CUCMA|nr:1-aminocyclopropane-1-carboxylate oxidase homolog 3-like [Cucurbita maxima]